GIALAGALLRWSGPKPQQNTIMVVEADESVRDLLTVTLARAGYLVLSAGNANDALKVLGAPLSPVNMILLDVNLPDADGVRFCQRLLEIYPKLPMTVCTGQIELPIMSQLADLGV